MHNHFDFKALLSHKREAISLNIEKGKLFSEILLAIPDDFLFSAVEKLKDQIEKDQLPLPMNQKEDAKRHSLRTLEKIKSRKYDFSKQNIEQGQSLNGFYPEAKIPLPQVDKKFKCQYCQQREFTKKSSLGSHYRNCKAYKENYNQEQKPLKKTNDLPRKLTVQIVSLKRPHLSNSLLENDIKDYKSPKKVPLEGQMQPEVYFEEEDQ